MAAAPQFLMQVDGQSVLHDPRITLMALERTYDGPASLTFRVRGDWTGGPFLADQSVRLWQKLPTDSPSGVGTLVFEGLLGLPQPVAHAGEMPAVEYTATDRRDLLAHREARLDDEFGSPGIPIQGASLETMAARLLALIGAQLEAAGVEAAFDFVGGAEVIQGNNVSLYADTIDGAVAQLAASAPGVSVYLSRPAGSSVRPRYTFVYLFGGDIYDLVLDDHAVSEIPFTWNVDGCCGAVRTMPRRTVATAQAKIDRRVSLSPAWPSLDFLRAAFLEQYGPATYDGALPSVQASFAATERAKLEAYWQIGGVYQSLDDLTEEELTFVFRKWRYPTGTPIEADMPLMARYLAVDDEEPASRVWQGLRVTAHDPTDRTVTLNMPAIKPLGRDNMGRPAWRERGRAKAATTELTWSSQQHSGIPLHAASRRWPETGFAGPAVQLRPTTCAWERTIEIPAGVDALQYAQFAHAVLSRPSYQVTVPLAFDLPTALWALGRRVNIRTAGAGPTNLEGIEAPLTGVRCDFAASPRTATLTMALDRKKLLDRGNA